jgi:hypothetical protein
MDGQSSRLDLLLRTGIGNEPFGQLGAFAISYHPAHYVTAEDVEDHIEIEVRPLRRAEQFRDVPTPELVGAGGQQFGLRVSRMDKFVSALPYLALALENPVHGANRAMILALIEQRGVNRGRRAILKPLLMQTRQHRFSFLRNQRPRHMPHGLRCRRKNPNTLPIERSTRKVEGFASGSHPDHWCKNHRWPLSQPPPSPRSEDPAA